MFILALKQLVCSRMLQHLRNGSQVASLVNVKLASCWHVDDVKAIRCHDGWVHVAVVQKVSHNLIQKIGHKSSIKTVFLWFDFNILMLLPSAAHPLRLLETFHGGCSSKPLLCISCHNCMQNKKTLVGHTNDTPTQNNMQLHATRQMVKQAQQEGNWGGIWPIKTTIRSSSMRRVSVFSPSMLPLVKQHHLVIKFREQIQCRVPYLNPQ